MSLISEGGLSKLRQRDRASTPRGRRTALESGRGRCRNGACPGRRDPQLASDEASRDFRLRRGAKLGKRQAPLMAELVNDPVVGEQGAGVLLVPPG